MAQTTARVLSKGGIIRQSHLFDGCFYGCIFNLLIFKPLYLPFHLAA
jgi:hypothetical protein